MNDLIERIEAASGPDREMDRDILAAKGTHVLEKRGRDRKSWWYEIDGPDYRRLDPDGDRYFGMPRYTASIDAALTLVPEGWMFGIERAGSYDGSPKDEAWCWPYESNFDPDWQNGQQGYRDAPDGARGSAATPALALCAAALKARAYLKETNNAD